MTTPILPDRKIGPPFITLSTWHGWIWHRDAIGNPVFPSGVRPAHVPGLTLTFLGKGTEPVSIPARDLSNTLVAQAHYNTVRESTWANRLVVAGFRAAVRSVLGVRM